MDRDEKLMGEYSAGHHYVTTIHEHIWQSGAILIVASLAMFALVVGSKEITPTSLAASTLAGTLSSALIIIWYLVRKRFAGFMQISYYRLQEIEAELGLWRNRYIHHLDNPSACELRDLPDDDREKLERLDKAFSAGREHTKRRAATMTLILTCLVPVVWVLWILYQVSYLLFQWAQASPCS